MTKCPSNQPQWAIERDLSSIIIMLQSAQYKQDGTCHVNYMMTPLSLFHPNDSNLQIGLHLPCLFYFTFPLAPSSYLPSLCFDILMYVCRKLFCDWILIVVVVSV